MQFFYLTLLSSNTAYSLYSPVHIEVSFWVQIVHTSETKNFNPNIALGMLN